MNKHTLQQAIFIYHHKILLECTLDIWLSQVELAQVLLLLWYKHHGPDQYHTH